MATVLLCSQWVPQLGSVAGGGLAKELQQNCTPPSLTSKPGAVNDLVVDGELASAIVDDHDPDASPAVGKGIAELAPEGALVDHGQGLDDVAGLGHCDDATLVDVEHAVLLEHGAEHGLDVDRRRRVAHEAGLLVELLGEEVDAQVAVLAGLGRRGDADDLAGTALEHDEVADADVVARNGHGAGRDAAGALDEADALAATTFFATFDADLLVVVVSTVNGVHDAVGGTLYAAAEGVVAALVVVVAHL